MRKIKWNLENGINGCDLAGEIEIEDDATDEDIEAAVRDDMWNFLSLTWDEIAPQEHQEGESK